ncbi:MAG TPA: branched-chain amino acid ABC transporter permease [Alphaproteobacteria bacterium]|nr:branched-chain amino acid ABC transporter permease [Alphaproteobacteria bacterium]
MDRTTRALLAAAVLLIGASFLIPDWVIFLATVIVAKALVVLGLVILWRTGLMSFGQALYYGLAGYAVGLAQAELGVRDAFLLVGIGILSSAAIALVLGFLLARYRDIFFAMLSLAFSMIFYGTLVRSETLGSTDGFSILLPHFLGYAPGSRAAGHDLLILTVVLAAAAAWLVHRYLASPMGHLTTAIRDNEIRVEYLGYSVERAIRVKYVLAAALAGAGGALVVLAVGHVDPDSTYWTTSGEFVFVTILSGAGSVLAPFLGSALFETLRAYATDYAPHSWQMVLGVCLLLLILFMPQGVWSLFGRVRRLGAKDKVAS